MTAGPAGRDFDRLRRLLGETGLDGVLVLADSSRDSDLAPFVARAHLGESFVAAPAAGEPHLGYLTAMERDEASGTGLPLLTPEALGVAALREQTLAAGETWTRLLTAAFSKMGLEPGAWALAGHPSAGTLIELSSRLGDLGWRWSSGAEILKLWRKFKPEDALGPFVHACEGVCAAMRAVARTLADCTQVEGELRIGQDRLRVGRLREVIRHEFSSRGLEEPHGNILAAGADGGVPHTQGESGRVLRVGEPLVIDLFPKGEVFADCTRTFCVGRPSEAFLGAFEAVRSALEEAHTACQPGSRGWELQSRACDHFEALGYPTIRSDPDTTRGYVHGLGHGVGYELHEYPSFRPTQGDEGVLEVGDILTLEPGLYDAEAGFGVRLEDYCYLGTEGTVNMTPLPWDWDPAAWPAD